MTLTQIEIFVELSHERNFSRVAEKLGITQPAVSHAVKKLESELGLLLISREKKEFGLTRSGHNVLIYCKEMVKQLTNIRREILSDQLGQRTKILLGTVWSVNNTLLPKMINSFKRDHPDIEISIFEGVDEEVEEWLENGTVDIGISGWSNDQFIQEKLADDQYMVVVPKLHPLSTKKLVEVAELSNYPIISSKAGCEPLIRHIAEHHKVDLTMKYEAKEILTILSMVREDLGISIFPELAVPESFVGVKFIPINTPIKRNIFIGHKKNQGDVLAVKLFMNHIAGRYKN